LAILTRNPAIHAQNVITHITVFFRKNRHFFTQPKIVMVDSIDLSFKKQTKSKAEKAAEQFFGIKRNLQFSNQADLFPGKRSLSRVTR
jgi:hypothetical protein